MSATEHCWRPAPLCGLGITISPTFVVGPHIRAGRLVRILADWHIAEVPVHAVYPDNCLIAAKVKSFVAYLAAEFRRDPDVSGVAGVGMQGDVVRGATGY